MASPSSSFEGEFHAFIFEVKQTEKQFRMKHWEPENMSFGNPDGDLTEKMGTRWFLFMELLVLLDPCCCTFNFGDIRPYWFHFIHFPTGFQVDFAVMFAALPWVFPKIGVGPQNGWFIMENPIKRDDLGGTIIFGNTDIFMKI